MIVRDKTRSDVIKQIGTLLDGTCSVCETRKQMDALYGRRGQYARMDAHCLRTCPIGAKLRELGKSLTDITKAGRPIRNDPKPKAARKSMTLTVDEYKLIRATGKSQREIAEINRIALGTLKWNIVKWKKEGLL